MKKNLKILWEKWKSKYTILTLKGCSKSIYKREVPTSKKQEKSKKKKKNKPLYIKELEEEQKTKPDISRMEEITKIRAEINAIEIRSQEKRLIKPGVNVLKR